MKNFTKNITKLFALIVCSLAVAVIYKIQFFCHPELDSGSIQSIIPCSHEASITKHANMLASVSDQDSSAQDALTQIVESNSIEDVKKFIEPETLFIFDYDNVLVEGKEDYGFDAWFCAMFAELEKNGVSKADAKAKLLPIYEKIQRSAVVQAVEPCTKTLIEYLKKGGHNVMILTVRSLCLMENVFRQLKSVEIDVENGAISENGINLALSKLGSKYSNGILFCDGYYKGPALKAFLLGKPELKIKNIVFVDDKLKNIESVKLAAQELGIKFVGIRYGCTDARASAYKLDEKSLKLAASLVNQDNTQIKLAVLHHSQAIA